MRNKLILIAILVLIMISNTIVLAQDQPLNVQVIKERMTSRGEILIFKLKEKLKKSESFNYTSKNTSKILIRASFMKISQKADAFFLVFNGYRNQNETYLTNSIGYCNNENLDRIKLKILATLDNMATKARKGNKNLEKSH